MKRCIFLLFIPPLLFSLVTFQSRAANWEQPGDTLYRRAEEGQWYKGTDIKNIDALYGQAIAAGSEKAVMADAVNKFYRNLAQQEESIHKLCQQMAPIAEKWEKGEADAEQLYHLAQYYGLPWCRGRDLKKAQTFLALAAEAGNVKAQYFMGRMMRDTRKKGACAWFKKAAEAGLPQAIASLGSCYLLGREMPTDREKGLEHINRAVASQNLNALFEVALCYLQGAEGLPRDREKARQMLEELVSRDYAPARSILNNSSLFRP